jgi:hypothetical protein
MKGKGKDREMDDDGDLPPQVEKRTSLDNFDQIRLMGRALR